MAQYCALGRGGIAPHAEFASDESTSVGASNPSLKDESPGRVALLHAHKIVAIRASGGPRRVVGSVNGGLFLDV
jgi:hypothetical protein